MKTEISEFERTKDYLICIDSDGCAMDTMDIKHKRCFGPCLIQEWNLQEHEKALLNRWDEINLYSSTRGINRFLGLEKLLREVHTHGIEIDGLDNLTRWVHSTKELSHQSLNEEIARSGTQIFRKALHWSETVNEQINQLSIKEKKAFPYVAEAVKMAHQKADVAIVSAANLQAVYEEWETQGLLSDVDVLLSQSAGTKQFCIEKLVEKGYEKSCVLMVGDAPGDLKAATENGIMYYPILVTKEKKSWEEFVTVGLDRFINHTFHGEYQQEVIQRFNKNLKA